MLAKVLGYEKRQQAAQEYIGDILWRVMMFLHPKSEIPIFSRYMNQLGKPVVQKTGRDIVDDMITRLKQRKKAVNPE